MQRLEHVLVLWLLAAPAVWAQEAAQSATRVSQEPLSAWAWYAELPGVSEGAGTNVDFIVPPAVFDKGRVDLADLRIYDARNQEIPYALRIRRPVTRQDALAARPFNRTTHPDRSVEMTLDLGEQRPEGNEIEVNTTGTDFRRRLRLEGSDDGKDWRTILDKAYLVFFRTPDPRPIDIHRISYPPARFRYLRLRVYADAGLENDKPEVTAATAYYSKQIPGELQTLPATLGPREPEPADGRVPGSVWAITFDHFAVPVERLTLDVVEDDFERPFQLELANPDEPRRLLAAGQWRRRAGEAKKPLEIEFPEVTARRLRLVVTDYRNPPLTITAARYTAPVRQVIVPTPAGNATPLRLYAGNPRAQAPHYDFAATLPATFQPPPTRITVGELVPNPDFHPPLPEQFPWLIYVILSIACLVLLAVLWLLAKEAMRQHGAAQPMAVPPAGS